MMHHDTATAAMTIADFCRELGAAHRPHHLLRNARAGDAPPVFAFRSRVRILRSDFDAWLLNRATANSRTTPEAVRTTSWSPASGGRPGRYRCRPCSRWSPRLPSHLTSTASRVPLLATLCTPPHDVYEACARKPLVHVRRRKPHPSDERAIESAIGVRLLT